jgi:hypothetical protein
MISSSGELDTHVDGLTAIDMKNLAVVFKALGGAFAVRHHPVS